MTTESQNQSVLAIAIPEADHFLAPVRSDLDSEAPPMGVDAHITIMYPFMPTSLIDERTTNELSSLFSKFPCFDFSLRLGWFGREVLLLVPEDDSPFVRMTEAVLSRWPQYGYYGGEYDKIEPHVSLGWGQEKNLARIEKLLSPHVPVTGTATSVSLSTGKPGFMTTRAEFPLSPCENKGTQR
jgi:hypothetical protein